MSAVVQPEAEVNGFREIRVPIESTEVPSFRLHLDIDVRGDQAAALRRVAAALDRDRMTLANGRRCVGVSDAVRWLLEQISTSP